MEENIISYDAPIDLDAIIKILESLIDEDRKDRVFMIWGRCDTIDRVVQFDVSKGTPCNDVNCGLCGGFVKSVKNYKPEKVKTCFNNVNHRSLGVSKGFHK